MDDLPIKQMLSIAKRVSQRVGEIERERASQRVGDFAPHTVLVEDPDGPLQPKARPAPGQFKADRPAAPWIPPPTEEPQEPGFFERLFASDPAPAPAPPKPPHTVLVEDPPSPAQPKARPAPGQNQTKRPAAPWIPPPTEEPYTFKEPSFLDWMLGRDPNALPASGLYIVDNRPPAPPKPWIPKSVEDESESTMDSICAAVAEIFRT